MKALFFVFSAGEKVKVINSADEHWWEVCVFFIFLSFFFFRRILRARERLTKSSAVYSFTHARARRSRGPGL